MYALIPMHRTPTLLKHNELAKHCCLGGEGWGSKAVLVGVFGSWMCLYCSVAQSHRNKPFLINGTLSPAASQRRNRVSGTSVSSEMKKKKSSACS